MEERNLHTPLRERTLYTLEVGSGLGNSIFSNAISFHDWQHSFRKELPGESTALRLLTVSWEWTGKRDRRQGEPEEQGCTQHPSSFLDLHSLSAAESKSPVQSFLHKTNQSIIYIHITNNSAPLQVMHRESHQLNVLLFQRNQHEFLSQHKILPLKQVTWISLSQLNTQLCKAGGTGKLASWATVLASCFPIRPVATACDCCAVWSELRFCGGNAEFDLDLYSVGSTASGLPVLGGMRSQQNLSGSSDTTDGGEEVTWSSPQTWRVPT